MSSKIDVDVFVIFAHRTSREADLFVPSSEKILDFDYLFIDSCVPVFEW